MSSQVFISYRSEDKTAADRVCSALEREDIQCWIAPRDIPIGREWATAIVTALQGCSHFVLILSSNSKTAKQISREAELADKQGLPIITFRVEDVEPPPSLVYFLGNLQWLDAFGDRFDAAVVRLADVVRGSAKVRPPDSGTEVPARISIEPPGVAQREPVVFTPAVTGRKPWAPYLIPLALILIAAVGLGAWYFSRPVPAPPDSPATEASAFGIDYLRQRDSGDLNKAYAMLGPGLQANWSRQQFNAAVNAMQARGKAAGYTPAGMCTLRERGAYTCDYRIAYGDGRLLSERLVIANRDGHWAVAIDRMPST